MYFMTKDDIYFYVQAKKNLEFTFKNKTYLLTYDKDSNGKDYDLYLIFSENELEFWAENKGRVIESYNYLVEAENSMFFKIFIRMYNRINSEVKS